MSEAIPMLSEPPSPSAEQLADWQALAERIRQGDRSQLAAWDEEGVAAGSPATYQVFVTQRVHQRLRRARLCWPARSLASSPSFGWIPPRPA